MNSSQDDYSLKEEHIDYECEWQELVLAERHGRKRFAFIEDCHLEELWTEIKKLKEFHERIVFLSPYHFEKTFQTVKQWPEVKEI